MIEADHDMRNPADMLVLDRVAKAVFHIPGIARVQTITRPLGTPIEHTSIPFQISQQSTGQIENLKYQQDRAADLLKQANEIAKTMAILQRQYAANQQLNPPTADDTEKLHRPVPTVNHLRHNIAHLHNSFTPLLHPFAHNLPA